MGRRHDLQQAFFVGGGERPDVLSRRALNGCVVFHSGCCGAIARMRSSKGKLEINRLLAPQRAVIVEGGDALRGRDEVRVALRRDARDEIGDGLLDRAVIPGRQRIGLGNAPPHGSAAARPMPNTARTSLPRCRKRKHVSLPASHRSTGPDVRAVMDGRRPRIDPAASPDERLDGADVRMTSDQRSRWTMAFSREPHCQRQSEFDPVFSSFASPRRG